MSTKSRRRTINFYKKHGTQCFYTGLNCLLGEETRNSDLAASREHLVPQSRKIKRKIQNNIVVAAALINNTIGNAPLKIKFLIKKDLREFVKTVPDLPDRKKIRKCYKRINGIFNNFRVFGILPWEEYNGLGESEKNMLRKIYKELLTPEEQWVIFGGYHGHSSR